MNKAKDNNSFYQRTLKEPIRCVGVGLHTGKNVSVVVHPAEVDTGINFLRKDAKPGKKYIPGRWYNVVETQMCTTIGNESGTTIHTIEHLVAALRGSGIDNALIEVDGPEIPIMDGSALPFIQTINNVGSIAQDAQRKIIWIQRPIEYRSGDKYAIFMPENKSRYTVQIEFDNPLVGSQTLSFDLNQQNFSKHIAPARTFGFIEQFKKHEDMGLIKGGSLTNAVVVAGNQVLNKEGLRFKDEFVRHKILDCIGDFGLIGFQVLGHYFAKMPGHELNNQVIRTLFSRRDAWSFISVEDYYRLTGVLPETHQDQDQDQKQKKFAGLWSIKTATARR